MQPEYDVIVVGAGIIGSSTAYQAAKAGRSVLLLEQFSLNNNLNSSHGGSRIFRFAHEEPVYMPLAKDALNSWRQLEKESNTELLRQCGLLWAGSHELVQKRASNMKRNGVECSVLRGKKINEKFRHVNFGEEWSALFDPNGGVLFADKCVLAAQKMAHKYGAEIHDHEKVLRIDSDEIVHVYTDKSHYTSRKIIVTVGPWLEKVLPNLGISARAQLMGVNYYKIKSNHDLFKTEKGSPMLLIGDHIDPPVYSLPDVDIPGHVKAGVHMGVFIDPDGDRSQPAWMETIPSKYFSIYTPDLDTTKPVKRTSCMYTVSEDEYFIIDKSPKHPHIFVAGGFSGYGFKFGPVVGEIMKKMAFGEPITYDLSQFKIDRQIKNKSKI
ncbi:hypothetical protein FO519_004226 [Halicephalobus sp. NKZ332]|nr:hypothetical protein FO519_004226 [Halicephalobus sp. NKZ332]